MNDRAFLCTDCGHEGKKLEQPRGWRCVCPSCAMRSFRDKAEVDIERQEAAQVKSERFTPLSAQRATAVRTDDNNPLREMGDVIGVPTRTRADVAAMEARGIVMTSPKDREYVERRHAAKKSETLKELRRVRDEFRTIRI